MKSTLRDSNFELLRIVAIFFIVLYHIVLYIIEKEQPDVRFWHAIQYPLHIGVPLFVLISGYYGIKTKARGIVNLLLLTFAYYTPLTIIEGVVNNKLNFSDFNNGGGKYLIHSMFAFSGSSYWFVKTYLWLYLLAPMINKFINGSKNYLYYLLLVCGYISIYMGLMGGDDKLLDGKNIINFIFIYCLGTFIRQQSYRFNKIRTQQIVCLFSLVNIILIVIVCSINDGIISFIVRKLFFTYCSAGLLLNSVLLFLIFERFKVQSRHINIIAASTFSIYLLHDHNFTIKYAIKPIVQNSVAICDNPVVLFLMLVLITAIIMLLGFIIDTLIKPIVQYIETKLPLSGFDKILSAN